MRPRRWRGHPSPMGAHQQTLLDEEGLVHVFDGLLRLADGDRQRLETHWAAAEALTERAEHRTVDLVEPELVDAEDRQTVVGRGPIDHAAAAYLGKVTGTAQQPIGNAGCAPCAAGDLAGTVVVDLDAEDAGGARNDRLEVGRRVVLEPGDEPEAVAQRPGDEARAGGGPDEREAREIEADRARRRALAQHDVELEVLHRGVEHLFHGARQAVDLVDEEHVALVEVREQRREITGPFDGRARGDVQPHIELGGDDVRQRRLAEPRRSGEQQVVRRLAAARGGLEDDGEVLFELGLADELGETSRAETDLVDHLLVRDGLRAEQLFAHDYRFAYTRCSACLRAMAGSPSSSTSASAARISSGA